MPAWEWIGRDLRYALRSLLRDRGSLAVACLALSLGIGATTAIFSVVDSVLIDAFPFRDSTRVVHFFVHGPRQTGLSPSYSVKEFAEYRAQNQVFTHVLGGVGIDDVLYTVENSTYRARGAFLDSQALSALGVRPALGRDITVEDGAPDAPPTFLITDRLWSERFNRDPGVLGTTLTLNGTSRTLIAVLPPRFLLHGADIFIPMTFTAEQTNALVGGDGNRPLVGVWTYAQLKPGVTKEQAAANVVVIARSLGRLYPDRYPEPLTVTVRTLADVYTAGTLKEMIHILVGAVLLLLLIACTNVTNLLLVRATARETELAVRASLGASPARLISQLLAENVVLAAAGTALGALLAYVGIQWVRAAIPITALPSEMEIRFSREALLAAIGITGLATLLCGLVPTLRAVRGEPQRRLVGTGKGVGLGSGSSRFRALLVTVQVTLAIVLLVGAGLMMRTFFALQRIDAGVNPKNVLVGQLAFPQNQRQTHKQRSLFLQRLLERVGTLPGVVAASPAVTVPLQRGQRSGLTLPGLPSDATWSAAIDLVGHEYFRVVGLSLMNGRLLSSTDVQGARSVAVVNRQFVQEFLSGSNPIGQTVTFAAVDRAAGRRMPFEIVGVVGDARNRGLREPVSPQAFLPYTVPGPQPGVFLVRTSLAPETLQHSVRQQIWAVDQSVALTHVAGSYGSVLLEQIAYRATMAAPAFGLGLLGTFAAIGLVLSAIGVFSVIAYTVSLQTREIGIRMALGAEPSGVMRLIVLKGLRPIAAGVLIGVGASIGLARLLASNVYGVTTTDPWTFAGVAIVLTGVGLAACVLPARHAMRIDPLIALRHQ